MVREETGAGPILRVFEVRAKPGCADTLMEKFAVTSAQVVRGVPGNLGYYFGRGVAGDDEYVVFTSVWRDLDAVRERFGAVWRESFLPEGYEALIAECSVRHVDVSGGWHVDAVR